MSEQRFHWQGEYCVCENFVAEITLDGEDFRVVGRAAVPRRPHVNNPDSSIKRVAAAYDNDDWVDFDNDWTAHKVQRLQDLFDEAAQAAFDRLTP